MGEGSGGKELVEEIKMLARKHDYKATLAACDRAIEADPSLALAHAARSRALQALGRPDEAADAIRAAVKLGPSDADSLAFCADAYYNAENHEEAAAYGRRALEMDPGNEDVRWIMVNALSGCQVAFEEVLRCCDDGIALNPASTRFRAEKADRLACMQRHDEAIACCDEGIKRCGTGLVQQRGQRLAVRHKGLLVAGL